MVFQTLFESTGLQAWLLSNSPSGDLKNHTVGGKKILDKKMKGQLALAILLKLALYYF